MAYRIERLNREMQKSISEIIMFKLKDPRVSESVGVLGVSVAKDLKTAKVIVSIPGENAQSTFDALKNCAGYIRKELAEAFRDLRTTPELTFVLDHSQEYSMRINEILKELKNGSDADN